MTSEEIVLELLSVMAKAGREYATTIRGARNVRLVEYVKDDKRIVILLENGAVVVLEPRLM